MVSPSDTKLMILGIPQLRRKQRRLGTTRSTVAEEKGKLQLLYVAPERLEQILGPGSRGSRGPHNVRSLDPQRLILGDADDQPTYNWKNHQPWSLING